jgi:hypothetical protein
MSRRGRSGSVVMEWDLPLTVREKVWSMVAASGAMRCTEVFYLFAGAAGNGKCYVKRYLTKSQIIFDGIAGVF